MKTMLLTLALAIIPIGAVGCGGSRGGPDAEFNDHFQEAIQAAEKGKDLVKSPGKKSR